MFKYKFKGDVFFQISLRFALWSPFAVIAVLAWLLIHKDIVIRNDYLDRELTNEFPVVAERHFTEECSVTGHICRRWHCRIYWIYHGSDHHGNLSHICNRDIAILTCVPINYRGQWAIPTSLRTWDNFQSGLNMINWLPSLPSGCLYFRSVISAKIKILSSSLHPLSLFSARGNKQMNGCHSKMLWTLDKISFFKFNSIWTQQFRCDSSS